MNTFKIIKETFDEIYGAFSSPVMLFDGRVRLINANQSFIDLTNANPDDLQMSNIFSFIGDEYFNGIKFIRNLPEDYVKEIRDVEGNRIPVRLKIKKFKDKDGVYQGGLGFITDLSELTLSKEQIKKLTLEIEVLKDQVAGEVPDKVLEERKKLELEVKESKEFLDNVVESCGDGIVIVDYIAKITRVNESFAHILGEKKEEIAGKFIYELWPTEGTFRSTTGETITLDHSYRDHIVKMIEKIFSLPGDDVKLENWEIYVLNKDGELVPLEMTMTIQRNAEGMVTGGVGSVRDITKKKKAEEEIREAKDFLENIFITTADGIMVTDNNGHIERANKAAEDITGHREDELIGQHVTILAPQDEEHKERNADLFKQLFEKGCLENWEHEWQKKDGRLYPVEVNIALLKDHEGKLVGSVSTIRDITERNKSEEALKMSEERYHNLIEHASDAVISANEEGIIITVNKRTEEMFGYSREELLGKPVLALVAPGERELQRKFLENFKETDEHRMFAKPMEMKGVRKDGIDLAVESACFSSVIHGENTFTVFVRDVTERRQAVEELRETKEQLEYLIENSLDPIVICDDAANLLKVNKAFLSMIGRSEEEVIGEPVYNFSILQEGTYESTTGEHITIGKEFFKEISETVTQINEEGKVSNWVSYYRNKENKIIPVNQNVSFLHNDKGERTVSFSVVRDITEQRKALRAVEEANRYRNEFFTNISHELRTPLTLAMGPIEEIIREGNGKRNGNLKKQLSLSLRNSRKLLKLINQLLEFSRLDSGSQHLIYEKRNLKEFIATIMDSFSFIAESQKITLTLDPGRHTNGAYIDSVKMEKVLFNLIGNAFKFTPEGGSINVGVTGNNGSGDNGNDHITISVADTGIGIEEESLPRIFERFHQVNGGFDRKYEGSGIGLALSKELVELMGGAIEVASEYGKGTTFSVHLPVGKAQIKEGSYRGNGSGVVLYHQPEIELSDLDHNGNGALEESIRGDKPLILIIDDNPDVRSYVSDIVKKEYDYITVRSGEEGLKKLEEHQPDVILCDIMMPGMDGHEFLKQVKSIPRLREIPFIFLTARAGSEMKIEGLEEGADDYVVKPFNSLELLARIKSLLRIRALMGRNTAQKKEIRSLTQKLQKRYGYDAIVGNSPPMRKVFQMLESVSDSELTVLIMGETGTGKELIANALHYNSPRKDGSFVAVNCGAIPRELMEREFFGHVKGAYTGAHQDREGYFEKANGGTLFLDEIGEMDKSLQVKLLRVLERGEISRVGTSETTKVDVRLIAASNKDLRTEVKEGNFREDLYYRIYVLPVQVPPLRERKEDIPLLVEHFIKSFQSESKIEASSLSEKEMNLLSNYSYPGNVRELEHIIERFCLLGRSAGNLFNDLPERSGKLSPAFFYDEILSSLSPLKKAREHTERDIITHTLTLCDNDYGVTAKKLNICLASLYKKIKEYGVHQ